MSVSITIKNFLKQKIEDCPSVQVVYGYERVNPTGWPCVLIKSTDMNGEFASSAQNSRTYSYSVVILFPIGQDVQVPKDKERLEYAEDVVATVIDEIINTMDTDIELTGSQSSVLYQTAADVQWGEFKYEGGVAKAAQLTLNVYTEVTVS